MVELLTYSQVTADQGFTRLRLNGRPSEEQRRVHQEKNLMAKIRGTTEILGYPDLPPDYRQERENVMQEAQVKLNTLGVAQQRTVFEHLDLIPIIQRQIDAVRSLLELNEIISVIKLERLPNVYANPPIFEDVLSNMLHNAIDVMKVTEDEADQPYNPIDDMRKRGVKKLFIGSLLISNANVLIDVKDNGSGMSSEQIREIAKVGYTTKAATGGTGLGVPIIIDGTEMLGGEVWAWSEMGKGSIFRLIIPI